MTYLVLARKWRPRSFDTLVGQDHVVRALTHALTTQRLHHAWLFTGTRGVGKTTLSRILAKSLNCHTGVTASPCGECAACTEIDAGRFVDYIELDAASNRGVDEMTQLLEQAVYSPSSGRFKVYMIDEVHMLSGHAFNAMLKTLEEPPPHVKFILATTDPQKIPATVLSRCLQFNLKQMTAESIISYLEMVLQQEHIQYDISALRLLAQAASGSMRDALSLTDQAIAYSADNLTLEAIQGMLGTIDQGHLINLLRALGAGNASQVVGVADDLAMRGLSYSAALADLAVLLSRVAIEQRIPASVSVDEPLHDDIKSLASELHPDVVQLFYSVAVHSRHELSLAPDEYAGFVMACLRMLSLVPPGALVSPPPKPPTDDNAPESTSNNPASDDPEPEVRPTNAAPVSAVPVTAARVNAAPITAAPVTAAPVTAAPASAAPVKAVPVKAAPIVDTSRPVSDQIDVASPVDVSSPAAQIRSQPSQHVQTSSQSEPQPKSEDIEVMNSSANDLPPWEDLPSLDAYDDVGGGIDADTGFTDSADADDDGFETVAVSSPAAEVVLAQIAPDSQKTKVRAPRLKRMTATDWPKLVKQLPLTGAAAQLARQSEWLGVNGTSIQLRMGVRTLAETSARARFRTVLSEHFGMVVELDIEYGETGEGTAHAIDRAHLQKMQKQAEKAAMNDPFVNALISEFGGQLVSGSIRAVV